MKLSMLLEAIPAPIGPGADLEIGSIHCRSQEVRPGGLFVAVKGLVADGHDYIDDAVARGAVAILTQKPVHTSAATVNVPNTRKALASVSSAFYGHPSEALCIIAVTGTNGKTSTAYLIEGILSQAGFNVGVIGTVNFRYCGKTFDNPVTTPESLDLQRILRDMKDGGVTHVVMEVSSHGIDLFRVHDCWFDAGVFTNLSQDHLDFHKDMKSYWSCKKRLFTEILASGPKKNRSVAVVNADDPHGESLLTELRMPWLSFGRAAGSTIRATRIQHDRDGIRAKVLLPEGAFEFASPLVGAHNVENILAATGVGLGLKIAPETIKKGIESVSVIPGRLQPVPNTTGRQVYVDFAHTPAALEHVLNSLAPLSNGRIICVFGCGGDRDTEKRPIMGEIAAAGCDLTVVTSDNPRTEPPMQIVRAVLQGVERVTRQATTPSNFFKEVNSKGFIVEPDRKQAIRIGIEASRPEDTVLIAGKGHETYQIIGNDRRSFNDFSEVRSVLETLSSRADA